MRFCFFFPQAALSDTNMEKQRKTIQATFQELIQLKYNPILVLTLVDQVCKAVRDNPLGTHKEIEDLKEKNTSTAQNSSNEYHLCCQLHDLRWKKLRY